MLEHAKQLKFVVYFAFVLFFLIILGYFIRGHMVQQEMTRQLEESTLILHRSKSLKGQQLEASAIDPIMGNLTKKNNWEDDQADKRISTGTCHDGLAAAGEA